VAPSTERRRLESAETSVRPRGPSIGDRGWAAAVRRWRTRGGGAFNRQKRQRQRTHGGGEKMEDFNAAP
jgi:hypothetical protein